MRRSSPLLTALLAAAAVLASAPAKGQDVVAAARAFEQARQAQLRGDLDQAAQLYESAHRAAPAPPALRSAIRLHAEAGHAAHAATLGLEARALYPDDAETVEVADGAIAAVQETLARLEVRCTPPCTLTVAGHAAGLEARERFDGFYAPGETALTAGFGADGETAEAVSLVAGEHVTLELAPPAPVVEPEPDPEPPASVAEPPAEPPVAPPATPRSSGLHPAIFATGAGLTAIAAAVLIWSGVDTLDAANAYRSAPTEAGYNDGLSRETRTNVLIGVTAGLAAASLVLALFTDFGGSADVAFAPTAGGAVAVLSGSLP